MWYLRLTYFHSSYFRLRSLGGVKMKKLGIISLVALTPLVLTGCNGEPPFGQEDFLHYLFPNPWDALAIFLVEIAIKINTSPVITILAPQANEVDKKDL